MQPSAPPPPMQKSRSGLLVGIVAVVVAAIAVVAALVLVWYPTTMQPKILLTDASYVTGTCVPVSGGFGNRYNWTFTLANTGNADGHASVGFELDGNSVGYREYFVPQHSQVTENATEYGAIYPTSADCGAPETPGISLSSVTGGSVIDPRMVLQFAVGPFATIVFTGVMLGLLQYLAHRRGFSILSDLGSSGWVVAIVTVFSAGLFSSVVTLVLMTPYNYPLDWTPAILYGVAYTAVGLLLFGIACRVALREGRRSRSVVR